MRRETPGPLSSIDMVPDEGRNDIQWALGELNKRQRTQADILFELNNRLAVHGIGAISRSAFNRLAVRTYLHIKDREETNALTTQLLETFKDRPLTDIDKLLIERYKAVFWEALELAQGRGDAKVVKELSEALNNIFKAQAMSMDINDRIQKELQEKTDAALEKVVRTRGLSADVAKDIRAQILGVKE